MEGGNGGVGGGGGFEGGGEVAQTAVLPRGGKQGCWLFLSSQRAPQLNSGTLMGSGASVESVRGSSRALLTSCCKAFPWL